MFSFKCTIILVGFILGSSGYSKPIFKDWSKKLNAVLLFVNGQPKLVSSKQPLMVSRYDCIRIVEGYCHDTCKIVNLNLVGFDNGGSPRPGEDRNHEVCFNKDVDYKWAQGPQHDRFLIVADSGGMRHGAVEIRVVEPKLRYIEIDLDGKTITIARGATLDIHETSEFSIKRIVTNFGHAKGVSYKSVLSSDAVKKSINGIKARPDALQFMYRDSVIGKISIRVTK